MSAAVVAEVLRAGAPFAVLGALLGAVYFRALRLNVEQYLGAGALGPAVALHVGRLLVAGAAFALIVQAGAVALLAALAGFLAARALALCARRTRP